MYVYNSRNGDIEKRTTLKIKKKNITDKISQKVFFCTNAEKFLKVGKIRILKKS